MATQLVSTGEVRVQSVSVIPTTRRRCNGRCKSCIAHLTQGKMDDHPCWVPVDKAEKILDFGSHRNATTAIITSKSEPLLDMHADKEKFLELVRLSSGKMDFVDIHTNGVLFSRYPEYLEMLAANGLTHLTISLASFNEKVNREFMGNWCEPFKVIRKALRLGLHVRMSVLLTKETVGDMAELAKYIKRASLAGAHAVVVRELWLPDEDQIPTPEAREIFEWVKANRVDMNGIMDKFAHAAANKTKPHGLDIRYIRELPWGKPIYSVNDVNVTFAVCDEQAVGGFYKSIQMVPRESVPGIQEWRIQGSWGEKGDVLG